ncbi:MAG: hypothetical protein HGA90_06355, partial [Alphaproteobacteria bacterium]|nr:hypothetical protein [Alphaproteobacteria bacterium]
MMTPSHTWPRLFVADDLAAGLRLTPAPEQAHYLLHVLRADNETPVRLFNARDGEWQGRLAISGAHKKQRVEILVGEQRRPQQAEPDLWLCGAPIKRAHFDFMIMKATELGVARIQPVLTARTQLRDVNVERCRGKWAVAPQEIVNRLLNAVVFVVRQHRNLRRRSRCLGSFFGGF